MTSIVTNPIFMFKKREAEFLLPVSGGSFGRVGSTKGTYVCICAIAIADEDRCARDMGGGGG